MTSWIHSEANQVKPKNRAIAKPSYRSIINLILNRDAFGIACRLTNFVASFWNQRNSFKFLIGGIWRCCHFNVTRRRMAVNAAVETLRNLMVRAAGIGTNLSNFRIFFRVASHLKRDTISSITSDTTMFRMATVYSIIRSKQRAVDFQFFHRFLDWKISKTFREIIKIDTDIPSKTKARRRQLLERRRRATCKSMPKIRNG